MQSTSALYQEIIAGNHWFEHKLVLVDSNVELGEDKIISARTVSPATKRLSVGNAISKELTAVILPVELPRRGGMTLYARARNSEQISEWIKQGTFYVDTRKNNYGKSGQTTMQIHAYDAMIKAEQDYPSTNHAWPASTTTVLGDISSALGVPVDSRTYDFMSANIQIDLPVSLTIREVLKRMAAMYGGNFVITPEEKLLFVPLYGLDPDVSGRYLADESGNALVFGNEGWFILV